MKATGIVRRIDDLGRVVIPKEIRRTLRIKEGDPLEIFTDRDGGIILKKYSPIEELTEFSKEYAESLQQTLGHVIVICDKDVIISVSGATKKEYHEKKVSKELEKIMNDRKTMTIKDFNNTIPIYEDEDVKSKYKSQVFAPIIAESDVIGAVVMLSKDAEFSEIEEKVSEAASCFLGKQME